MLFLTILRHPCLASGVQLFVNQQEYRLPACHARWHHGYYHAVFKYSYQFNRLYDFEKSVSQEGWDQSQRNLDFI